jgi:hypothetical protein
MQEVRASGSEYGAGNQKARLAADGKRDKGEVHATPSLHFT